MSLAQLGDGMRYRSVATTLVAIASYCCCDIIIVILFILRQYSYIHIYSSSSRFRFNRLVIRVEWGFVVILTWYCWLHREKCIGVSDNQELLGYNNFRIKSYQSFYVEFIKEFNLTFNQNNSNKSTIVTPEWSLSS